MLKLDDAVIRDRLKPYGVAVDARFAEAIRRYISILVKWNQQVNLTAIVDPEEILERHFGESMFAAQVVRLEGRLADVGSGAGFPGLAVKLICPGLEVTLIESSHKKAAFLSDVCRELQLEGVRVLTERMEDVKRLVDGWDTVTSRAVGNLKRTLSWSRKVVRADGRVVLWVGADGAEEARRVDGWRWGEPVIIPGSKQRFIMVGSLE